MIIQHLKNLYLKIEIHPLTLLYFVLAWIGGYLKWYLSTLMIVCLHELCHLLMAYYFHFEIEKIEILPFGAYLSLHDFYFHSIWQEICVVLAGPCSHFLIYMMILSMHQSIYQEYLLTMNMFIFGFNLLPIYPLDGNRFLGLLLQSVMDLKQSLIWQLKISVLVYCLLFVFYFQTNTIIILCYLFIQQFYLYKFIPDYLRRYYSRIPTFLEFDKVYIHKNIGYRRGYQNYYMKNGQLINQVDMMYQLLETVKL
ncbi:site-2 protease family protein [Candidatus Stoquefichus massiliensis]|uniref:site-2 protease family protein n=1 Tax=Candidatus Stoquefichus massiliensis TaxID=1470350 RepID=UPI0004872BC8|nr:site-2 protease family protein [Candidatus Stoquefichus massiliensis]